VFAGGSSSSANFAQLVTARGREALVAELGPLGGESGLIPRPQEGEIRLTSNENPFGPPPPAMAAIRDGFAGASRYPSNTQPNMSDLTTALADRLGCEASNIVLGAGSGELLKRVAQAYVSPERHLVTASPTYLQTSGVARYLRAEVKAISLADDGKLDLDAMADASRGAGLVFFCNPNNPTGTVHSASDVYEFMRTVQRTSPETVIHFDEAYHEYVTDPNYESVAWMACEVPNVFVSRTFSKIFGMAGMRVGYGVASGPTIEKLQSLALGMNISVPSVSGAYTALQDPSYERKEKGRNTEARQYTADFFNGLGYEVFDSNTNFIFANIGRPAADFRSACREHGVGVGRDFPPMEKTHARISIGTMDEMQRACEVFKEVLA
tara:strand:- start:2589 stop:3731 length:1143 start_codon:yes stop_codon:yes gene_type:complete